MAWRLPRRTPTDPPLPLGRRLLRYGAIGAAGIAGVLALGVVWVMATLPATPGIGDLRKAEAARPSVLLSVDGKELATFSRAQQEHVKLEQVSPNVVNALLATEDRRFYDHRGVDVRRTIAALWRTANGETQGGSTITQQLARNLFPEEIGRERSVQRKLKEMITALRIERNFSKKQILESYLNSAPFLYNVVGIEMAARTYYDKPASELGVLESATLIGMLKGTAYYNPVLHPERAKARRNVVLGQMQKAGKLSEDEYRRLAAAPLRVTLTRQADRADAAPHFVAQVRRWLIDWADQHDYNLYTDGLVVKTTLDSRLQDAATRALEREASGLQAVADVEWAQSGARVVATTTEPYEKARAKVDPFTHLWKSRPDLLAAFVAETPEYRKAVAGGATPAEAQRKLAADTAWMARLKAAKTRLEAGFLAVDPATAEVRAWVGSRDFDADQFDHVSQAARQPGSTFKPFVYGAALESGIGPERTYVDGPVAIPLGDGRVWRPTDMHDATNAPMSVRDGLVYSKNTITVQVAQEVGVHRIAALARAMGIDQSRLDEVPSLALGTSPVTLYEMVNAYATIARQGEYRKPVLIRSIADRHGTVVAEFVTDSKRALSNDSAVELIDMMRGVVTRGTGAAIKSRFGIDADVAGKTGTTQNSTDGWFMLMHPNLVAGAWVGFNDNRVTIRSSYWGQGGHNALLVVGDFFRDALKHGLIDRKASFPQSRRPPPPEPAVVDPGTEAADVVVAPEAASAPPAAPAAVDVAVTRDGSTVVIGDRAAVTAVTRVDRIDEGPPKSAEELDRALAGMGSAAARGASLPGPATAAPPPPAPVPVTMTAVSNAAPAPPPEKSSLPVMPTPIPLASESTPAPAPAIAAAPAPVAVEPRPTPVEPRAPPPPAAIETSANGEPR